jgi:hypothetical protein
MERCFPRFTPLIRITGPPPSFQPWHPADEPAALRRRDAARDRSGCDPARFGLEAAAWISWIWSSVVWLMVETRT